MGGLAGSTTLRSCLPAMRLHASEIPVTAFLSAVFIVAAALSVVWDLIQVWRCGD